jgi:hypothetical protein
VRAPGLTWQLSLNASLFIRGDNEVIRNHGSALPNALTEIENRPGLDCRMRIAKENPTAMLQGSKSVAAEPAPRRGAAGLARSHAGGFQRARAGTRVCPGDAAAHRRVPLLGRRDWGGKRSLRPPRGWPSRPGKRAKQNRLRHLLTIWRGVSSRAAIQSLDSPFAARRMPWNE